MDWIEKLRTALVTVDKINKNETKSGFSSDRKTIQKVFSLTNDDNFEDILVRLTVIDSLYSTQMTKRYYGLEELAHAMLNLSNQQESLNSKFLQFAEKKDSSIFDYSKTDNSKGNLFSDCYGIDKRGDQKGVAISLISKYAYFATNYKFPIYDSIVCETIPDIWVLCRWKEKCPTLTKYDSKLRIVGDKTMEYFLQGFEQLHIKLGREFSIDQIDTLLWFIGKIRRGNLSLVLDKQHYKSCVDYLKKNNLLDKKYIFKIDCIENLEELPFISNTDPIYSFFEIAKKLNFKKS